MGRLDIHSKESLGSMSGGERTFDFFQLEDDGDRATVRFMYEDEDGGDLDYLLVHQIELKEGGRRYVSCAGLDEEGILNEEDCPLCQAKVRREERLFLKVYVEKDDEVKIWERGKSFVSNMVSLMNEIGNIPLVEVPVEIERIGKKGDRYTKYDMFPEVEDGTTLRDLPETPDVLGTHVLELTYEELEDAADGKFSLSDDKETTKKKRSPGKRRPGSRRGEEEEELEEAPRRRKATSRSPRGEKATSSRPSAPNRRRR